MICWAELGCGASAEFSGPSATHGGVLASAPGPCCVCMGNRERSPPLASSLPCRLPNAPSIAKAELVDNAVFVNVRPGAVKPNSLGEPGRCCRLHGHRWRWLRFRPCPVHPLGASDFQEGAAHLHPAPSAWAAPLPCSVNYPAPHIPTLPCFRVVAQSHLAMRWWLCPVLQVPTSASRSALEPLSTTPQ